MFYDSLYPVLYTVYECNKASNIMMSYPCASHILLLPHLIDRKKHNCDTRFYCISQVENLSICAYSIIPSWGMWVTCMVNYTIANMISGNCLKYMTKSSGLSFYTHNVHAGSIKSKQAVWFVSPLSALQTPPPISQVSIWLRVTL